jgi:hypothetical protein
MKYGKTTNKVSVFIITPSHFESAVGSPVAGSDYSECKYPVEVERLHRILTKTYKNVKVATYDDTHGAKDAPERTALMDSTGKGRVFIQYTPQSY